MHTTGRPRRLGGFANSSAIALLADAVLVLLAATAQKSEETGEAHPAASARIRHMRGERPACARQQLPPESIAAPSR
jgi:hypothetical protein